MTAGGNGLGELGAPFSAYLYEPPVQDRAQANLLTPAESGLNPDGKLFPLTVVWKTVSGKRGAVMINPVPNLDQGLEGCWLCVERASFAEDTGLYFFELRGLPVLAAETGQPLATVTGYLETAAHGVLVTTTPDGAEVLIPLVETFCQIDRAKKIVQVKQFDAFRV